MNRLILAFVLLLAATAPAGASSVHVGDKQYAKEVTKILAQYKQEIGVYAVTPQKGVDPLAVANYVTLVEWDISLVQSRLHLFKKHKVKQDDVDAYLAQLSRDIEDAPPPIEAPQTLDSGDDPRPKA